MGEALESFEVKSWEETFARAMQNRATKALEAGKVVFFPELSFAMSDEELAFLHREMVEPKAKNISYDLSKDRLGGASVDSEALRDLLKRYALSARQLVEHLFPHYRETLVQGRTSLRPVEIKGRQSSYRKDDTRLHVDSFPSSPVHGKRILRLFTNVNPEGKARMWRVGEPFEAVVRRFGPSVPKPNPYIAHIYKALRITKTLRSPYDHYMLHLHDKMKEDMGYQETVTQEEVAFQPGVSWMCFTDQVSHAAMEGQHVFEQTFYLPASGLKHPELAPLAILEQFTGRPLLLG